MTLLGSLAIITFCTACSGLNYENLRDFHIGTGEKVSQNFTPISDCNLAWGRKVSRDTDDLQRVGTAPMSFSDIFTVSTVADLLAALDAAQGGETIQLTTGDYSGLTIGSAADFSTPVTITSADADAPATLSSVQITDATGLIFNDLAFQETGVTITRSQTITFTDNSFDGSGTGISVLSSADITIEESWFDGFDTAALIWSSADVTITGNTFTGIADTALETTSSNAATTPSLVSSLTTHVQAVLSDAASVGVTLADNIIATAVLTVSNADELAEALQNASGGEAILLAGGEYGALSMGSHGIKLDGFDIPVQIVSADPDNPAIFSGLTIKNMKGLSFDGILFDYTFDPATDGEKTASFKITSSQNITIENSVFDGDFSTGTGDPAVDGYGTGLGLSVTESANITLTGNEVYNFWKGMRLTQSSDLTLQDNNIHDFRSDGINLVEVRRVLVEDNYIHDRHVSPLSSDHGDMIQLWTNNTTTPSQDVIVRGNLLDIGSGDYAQSIFMTNTEVSREGAGTEMYLRNFLIEDNIIINSQRNAIKLGAGDNMVVRNNTVVLATEQFDEARGNQVPLIDVDRLSTNVEITGNVTSKIVMPKTDLADWTIANNLIVQYDSPLTENYYADIFLAAKGDLGGHPEKLVSLPGSIVADMGIGAAGLIYDDTPDTPFVLALSHQNSATLNRYHFDAGLSADASGPLGPEGANYLWDFGDGTQASGMVVDHLYTEAGIYDVTLTVTFADGTVMESSSAAEVAGSDLLSFDTVSGTLVIQSYGTLTEVDAPLYTEPETSTLMQRSMAQLQAATTPPLLIDLGNPDDTIAIDYALLNPWMDAASFTLDLQLMAQAGSLSAGELMRIPNAMRVTIEESGELFFEIITDDQTVHRITTVGANLTDNAWHDVQLVHDGVTGLMGVTVDGWVLASTQGVFGSMQDVNSHGLYIGGKWSAGFDGLIRNLDLNVDTDRYSALADLTDIPGEILFDLGDDVIELNGTTVLHQQLAAETRLTAPGENFGFAFDFQRNEADDGEATLLWNHGRLGIQIYNGGLKYTLADADGGLHRTVLSEIELNDTETHRIVGLLDESSDTFHLILDDEVVASDSSQDWDIVRENYHDYGWSVGNKWHDPFIGQVNDLILFTPESQQINDYLLQL